MSATKTVPMREYQHLYGNGNRMNFFSRSAVDVLEGFPRFAHEFFAKAGLVSGYGLDSEYEFWLGYQDRINEKPFLGVKGKEFKILPGVCPKVPFHDLMALDLPESVYAFLLAKRKDAVTGKRPNWNLQQVENGRLNMVVEFDGGCIVTSFGLGHYRPEYLAYGYVALLNIVYGEYCTDAGLMESMDFHFDAATSYAMIQGRAARERFLEDCVSMAIRYWESPVCQKLRDDEQTWESLSKFGERLFHLYLP